MDRIQEQAPLALEVLAYKKSLRVAATETGMSKDDFPADCPFSLDEALNTSFFPNS